MKRIVEHINSMFERYDIVHIYHTEPRFMGYLDNIRIPYDSISKREWEMVEKSCDRYILLYHILKK